MRGEAVVAEAFEAYGVEAFFPVEQRTRTIRGQVVETYKRLYAGYVFARVPGVPRWHVIYSDDFARGMVSGYIPGSNGLPARISDREMASLRNMGQRARDLEVAVQEALRLRSGDVARYKRGPMADLGDLVLTAVNGEWAVYETAIGTGKARVSDLVKVTA